MIHRYQNLLLISSMVNVCTYTKVARFASSIHLQNVINSSHLDLFTFSARQYINKWENYSEDVTDTAKNVELQCSEIESKNLLQIALKFKCTVLSITAPDLTQKSDSSPKHLQHLIFWVIFWLNDANGRPFRTKLNALLAISRILSNVHKEKAIKLKPHEYRLHVTLFYITKDN